MKYDDWKLDTPDGYDYEEGCTCDFCGEDVPDGNSFCNKSCRQAYYADV